MAGALAAALRIKKFKVGVMKPISCGGREDAEFLKNCAGVSDSLDWINPICLKEPLSPNVAAKIEKKTIDLWLIDQVFSKFKARYQYLVVEGCGGLLVPINDKFLMVDMIARMKARPVLVSRSGLGAINHCLLSIEALKKRGIKPKGMIFNRQSAGAVTVPDKTNPRVVSEFSGIPSLGLLPFLNVKAKPDVLGKEFLKHIDLKKIL